MRQDGCGFAGDTYYRHTINAVGSDFDVENPIIAGRFKVLYLHSGHSQDFNQLLGGDVDVATLRGSVSLKVPRGTSSDTWLRVRGQGIESRGQKGDHLVRVVIAVPPSLSADAERTVREHL